MAFKIELNLKNPCQINQSYEGYKLENDTDPS